MKRLGRFTSNRLVFLHPQGQVATCPYQKHKFPLFTFHRLSGFSSSSAHQLAAEISKKIEKHAKKGRLVYVAGKLQTRRWKKDGEDSDRFSTEILIAPGGRVQFLDKVNGNGNGNGNGAHAETAAVAAAVDGADNEIPF